MDKYRRRKKDSFRQIDVDRGIDIEGERKITLNTDVDRCIDIDIQIEVRQENRRSKKDNFRHIDVDRWIDTGIQIKMRQENRRRKKDSFRHIDVDRSIDRSKTGVQKEKER